MAAITLTAASISVSRPLRTTPGHFTNQRLARHARQVSQPNTTVITTFTSQVSRLPIIFHLLGKTERNKRIAVDVGMHFLGSISNDAEANLNSCRYRLDDHQRAAQRPRAERRSTATSY